MVIYFTTNVVNPPMKIYMGADENENDVLIRWGWPEDVWFHVDNLSSAHVYLRLEPNQTIDDIPSAVIDDCAQLVKANSIKGNKMNNVDVVYTMWSNLKKTKSMDAGQVGFKNEREVKKIKVEKRINEIVNRLNKTKVVNQEADLQAEREARDRKEREETKARDKERRRLEKEEAKKREEMARLKSYDWVMKPELMKSNKEVDSDASDDFM